MSNSTWRERALHLLRELVAPPSSQSEVARRLGTRQSSVSSWLSGARSLKRENAEAICRAAGLPEAYLADALGPLDTRAWKRLRKNSSGVRPEPGVLDLVRRVIDDHHIREEHAAKLLALPWGDLGAVLGEIDEDAVLGQWMVIRTRAYGRPVERPKTGAHQR